jgi:peptidoglycan/LPS O-acetylase OafA/YrhL
MHYRPDIDGLRALAVVAVVLYHADHGWLPGGFTGVDVFFVISGYLITRLIAADLERGQFSLVRFYERRARRILPALLLVLAAATAAALAWLLPEELARYGESLLATLLFGSNIYFWRVNDYFSTPPDSTPLLHTWSLAVEEQFYLVLPVVLLAMARCRAPLRTALLWAALAGSLLLAEWGAHHKPTPAFYLGPTRAWELLCGAVLALRMVPPIRSRAVAELAAAAGLAAIGAGFVILSEQSRFPGIAALLPCVGAALAIHAGDGHRTLVSRLLGLRGLVAVGLISYSLYLWHWVVLVFARHLALRELTVPELAALIALSVGLAALTWRFVEQPFRRTRPSVAGATGPSPVVGTRLLVGSAAAASVLLAAGAAAIVATGGLPGRLPPSALEFARGQQSVWDRRSDCEGRICELDTGGPDRPAVLLWGDSHAAALAPALQELAAAEGRRAIVAFKHSCPPLVGFRNFGSHATDCRPFVAQVLQRIDAERVGRVILHARWPWYVEGTRNEQPAGAPFQLTPEGFDPDGNARAVATLLAQTIAELRARGAEVTVVTSVPEVGVDAPELLVRSVLRNDPLPHVDAAGFAARTARSHAAIAAALVADPAAAVVHLYPELCRDGRCALARDGRALYHDDDHLSIDGARYLRQSLAQALAPGPLR